MHLSSQEGELDMVVPQNLNESTMSMVSPLTTSGSTIKGLVAAKVYHHLLRLRGVELQVVVLSPRLLLGYLLSVCGLVPTADEAFQSDVVSKLNQLQ